MNRDPRYIVFIAHTPYNDLPFSKRICRFDPNSVAIDSIVLEGDDQYQGGVPVFGCEADAWEAIDTFCFDKDTIYAVTRLEDVFVEAKAVVTYRLRETIQ